MEPRLRWKKSLSTLLALNALLGISQVNVQRSTRIFIANVIAL
jgi:hypothetical protein